MKEIRSIYYLDEYLEKNESLENLVFKNLDLRKLSRKLISFEINESIFIGCTFDKDLLEHIVLSKNYILPSLSLPFELFPRKLYSIEDLYNNFDPNVPFSYKNSTDYEIYTHFVDHSNKDKLSTFLKVTESIHDSSIRMALNEYVRAWVNPKKIVGVMGGHRVSRQDPDYMKVCKISKELTEKGYMMASGGGPGMMEATHLGAYFAGRTEEELEKSIEFLAEAPFYTDEEWLSRSYWIMHKYPPIYTLSSLSIPTWVHGHEPPNPFPGKIAKFFSAAIRQEVLIEITKGGLIFSRGSAGTVREIFQTVEQNHYDLWDNQYPMVFLDKDYWINNIPVYQFIETSINNNSFKNIDLTIFDEKNDIIEKFLNLENQTNGK